ncbi:hypothetical protein EIB18_16720 [Caulobacter vibrioides]|uniref:Glycine zipper domain-containing protein n=2 Tax=Caulobacter vibrioides TaxID=155892 RepID=Q9A3P6_CAUVC|nr:hypothetical protein [Caulobacter vibrioides]YP_002518631.1 hypothetical protein CCNA_03258 [Caulobacter vibrioides NA1000]AAK25118.1 hypothetical protein CC_3156 [Caulobacter vibrioides CB15]ACL96723.1 hypothetical protein CCNA_03258 [Caulobacter vibrioides NA1000]ATC26041.1 hypothetical protein CA608_16625 [Caulobacter vibrioides]ATC29983.1 hypothetical protein CA607_16980 [Caulobacter vibrioides]AZH14182.1 hypothetical protein EIB18_16720 [Caulobacter vibrioides]
MTLRRLAPLALILGGLSLTQTGCMAAAAVGTVAGTAIGVTGAVVGGAAKVGGKAVVATGKAIIPGDSDKNDLADRREEE